MNKGFEMTTVTFHSDMEMLCENLNNALKEEIEESFRLQEDLERAKRQVQILEYAIKYLERKLDGHDSV